MPSVIKTAFTKKKSPLSWFSIKFYLFRSFSVKLNLFFDTKNAEGRKLTKEIHKGSQMWRKMLTQNLGLQNLTAFILNLTFNFVSLKIARGLKILRAFVNPLNEWYPVSKKKSWKSVIRFPLFSVHSFVLKVSYYKKKIRTKDKAI